MLSYAFRVLRENNYSKVETESFENALDLYASILIKGTQQLLKRGMGREYLLQEDNLSTLRGKVDISSSIKNQSLLKRQLVCLYDEFSLNSNLNRILKTTLITLLKTDIDISKKKEIKKLLLYFTDVEILDIHHMNWNTRFDRNNQTYQMLISVCRLVINEALQTKTTGKKKLMDFEDDQELHQLFENFVFEYFKKEFKDISTKSPEIKWKTDDEFSLMLPRMKSDIVLETNNQKLIIDTKFYEKNKSGYYGAQKVISGNLYQIFTYVKNEKEFNENQEVSGMLLYATTEDQVELDLDYAMSGNKISVKTINLNKDFSEIRKTLNTIVQEWRG